MANKDQTDPAREAIPTVLALPIGIDATDQRREFDSLGDVEVPADHYWGAQTQRSLQHFNIGHDVMPKEVYHAYGFVKQAAAMVNTDAGRLPKWKGDLIAQVCREVTSGKLDSEFPLYVWQTGSGTQSNMNVNEVISNRCIQLVGGQLGSQEPVHPNDHVNMGQSSNDTFPTAMHIAAYKMTTENTIPALRRLRDAFEAKSKKWDTVVKIGRTHLEDATPLTVGQEWSGYVGALDDSIVELEHATAGLLQVAMGGTAVGTGLNSPVGFGDEVAATLAKLTGFPIKTAANKFTAQGTLDRMVRAHAGLKTGEDGPTHADPQSLQLLQDNFPLGTMITLTPWDPQEVWFLVSAALASRPAVIAPFVTRPPEVVVDRDALGLPPAAHAAQGVCCLRKAKGRAQGTVVFQGAGVTNAFVTQALPLIEREKLNLNVYAVTSCELFDLLPEAERERIFPEAHQHESMGITDFTLATMTRWVRSDYGRAHSLHPFRHGHFLGSGSGAMVMTEAGLDGISQFEAIRAYVRDR